MIKLMRNHWHWRRHKFYRKNIWHLVLDLVLGIMIVLLVATVLTMHYYQPDLSNLFNFSSHKVEKIDLNNPPLEVSALVEDQSFKPGESVFLKIDLHNSYSRDINNIKIIPESTNGFSITKIEDVNQDANVEIDKKVINIGSLEASKSQEINLEIYFKTSNNNQKNIQWQIQLEYLINSQIVKDALSLDDLQMISDVAVSSVAYYNSPQGDQLGAGPIPPIAYLPTNYWIFWNVVPNGDFNDFVMSAQLPLGVELTDSRSLLAGELNYNSASRKIVWQISELVDGADDYRVGFEVQLIPEEEQVGKILPLVSGVKYYTQDKLSQKAVSGQMFNLSTNLDYDHINQGQGVVLDQ